MSLPRAFHRKVQAVQIRCSLNLLLCQAGRVLIAAGVLAVVATLLDRLLAVPVLRPGAGWVLCGVSVSAAVILWIVRVPNRMQASVLLDERLGLHERSSTTLALAASDDPFAEAARIESLRRVRNADLRGHFPIRLSQGWRYGAAIWALAISLFLLLPQKDLFGLMQRKQRQDQQKEQLERAKAEVRQNTDSVRAVIQKLDDPALQNDLEELKSLTKAGKPQEVKREAIKKLGDLSDKLEQMQAGTEFQATEALQRMLKQLRGSADPFSQDLRMALGKGDFAKAAEMLRELQKQLADGSLSEQKRQELAEQFQQLATEMQKLAQQQGQVEEELERLGLDKSLARAGAEQLREALRKQGLSSEQIEQLMNKMQASQAASAQCSGLGQELAGLAMGGGVPGDGLSGAIGQLDALDALQQQAIMLRASLDEISRCAGALGKGMGQGHWGVGKGGGEAGKGIGLSPGSHSVTSDPLTAQKTTRSTTRSDGRDPVVATWYFQEAPIRGEAQQTFKEVVQAGRAEAAEAISENQIPRRYEGAVKAYFNDLEESGPTP